MLNRIKSHNIQILILEYLKQNQILDIFKNNKYYQIKFNLTQDDYLSYFFSKITFSLESILYYDENRLFKKLKKFTTKNISNDILKKNLIHYCAKKSDFMLSFNNIFFNEIINEKILLKHKKIAKINFEFEEYLSQSNIISLIKQFKPYEEIENYLNERIKEYDCLFKKLELLANTELSIEEIFFDVSNIITNKTFYIDNNKDIIEYKENLSDKEKNILINFKLKRAELINKILEKNCKNIIKLEYMVIDKHNEDESIIFPLIDLGKFINLIDLDLTILYTSQEYEHVFEFQNNFEKLKNLKIKGYNFLNKINYIDSLSVHIKKEILDKLETLKIKKVRWFVLKNENFHFKNLEKINIEFFQHNEIININSKKYFHEELLNGNISWEKLKRIKIKIPFDNERINKSYKNEEIRDFINIANLRDVYDSSDEFFQEFFKFIFKNQILYIKTNKENKAVDDFVIKIHDDYGWNCSGYKPTIKYEKKSKIVNITLGGRLYCKNVFDYPVESPLRLINLSNAKIDSKLDGLFIDKYTLDQFKKINELILSLNKNFEEELKEYKKICQNRDIEKDFKKKCVGELDDKIEIINKKIELLSQDNNKDTFENKLLEINKLILLRTKDEIEKIKKQLIILDVK